MHRRRFGRKLAQLGVVVGLSSWSPPWLSLFKHLWDRPEPESRGPAHARRVFLVGADHDNALRARDLTEAGVPVTLFDKGAIQPGIGLLGTPHPDLVAANDTGLFTLHAQHRVLGVARVPEGYSLRVRETDELGHLVYEGDHRCTEVFLARGAQRELRDAATRGYPMHVA